MLRHFIVVIIGAVIGFGAVPAAAQNGQPQGLDADTFIQSALQTVTQLDQGGASEIYDSTSFVFRNAITREQFTTAMNARAQQLENAVRRDWVAVTRNAVAEGDPNLTAGLYVTVTFQVIGTPGTPLKNERVTFRADEDRVWRLAGVAVDEA